MTDTLANSDPGAAIGSPQPEQPGALGPDNVRVAAVQFQMRGIEDKQDFAAKVEYFVAVAADYGADFITFPELFTLQLLSMEREPLAGPAAIDHLTSYTEWFREFASRLAIRCKINIIAGSHPARDAAGIARNVAYVCLRDGRTYAQEKIHATPSEASFWGITGGDDLRVIETDRGPIGVLICYDSEFPELARHLADQGALMLFVPFCTDDRRGYLRVRYCSHARAIENQCYVVLSGVSGNLPNVRNMDIHYAQSCVLTPCDVPFARDGVAIEAEPNEETVILADLRLDDLRRARASGTVRNLADRRPDLYSVNFGRGAKPRS
jgi:predicted amidohydrolase